MGHYSRDFLKKKKEEQVHVQCIDDNKEYNGKEPQEFCNLMIATKEGNGICNAGCTLEENDED